MKPLNILKLPKIKKIKIKTTPRRKSEPTITKKTKNFLNKTKQNKQISESEFIFRLPETDFLTKSNTKISQKKEMDNINKENSIKLEKILEEYGVLGKIVGYKTGPIVTLYQR